MSFSSMLTSSYHSLTSCIYKSVQVMGLITSLSRGKLVDSLLNSSHGMLTLSNSQSFPQELVLKIIKEILRPSRLTTDYSNHKCGKEVKEEDLASLECMLV